MTTTTTKRRGSRYRRTAVLVAAATMAAGAVSVGTVGAAGAATGGSEALTATDVGISPSEIRLGVIADTGSSLAPGLFQGSVDAVQAWARYMNAKEGGLAGRKIVIDTYDSGLDANKARQSIIEACSKDFALVGTSALFVNNIDDLVTCKDLKGAATGLPDFPVLTTDVVHQCSPVSYPINPPLLDCATKDQVPQTYRGGFAATSYFVKKFGKGALHGVYLYPSDLKPARDSWVPQYKARQDAGIKADASFDVSSRALQSTFTPFVQAMKDSGSTYASQGGAANVMISLMKEAKLQGVTSVKVWDCALQCYDKTILAAPETEGLYVSTLFLPFDETKSNPMLANFIKYTTVPKADGFAAQAWAAGLLLRDAVKKAVVEGGNNAVTRTSVLAAVKGISSFDADGMIGAFDPGAKSPSSCYALSQVKGGKFVRVFPKKAGTFACDPKAGYSLQLDLR